MIPCPEDLVIPPDPERWAARAWLLLALAVVVIDTVLQMMGYPTLSTYVQRKSRRFPWLKWVGFAGLVFLAWHLFVGFPW